MADTKITALAAIATVDPAADVLPIVDISDTSMAASGTTKKITSNQILGSGGTATLASATITGALVVDTTTLVVDATNNRVGIGTATPSYPLHVKLDQNAYTFSRIDNQNVSSGAYAALMLAASGNSWGIGVGSTAANSNALAFFLDAGGANSLKMVLNSTGNLVLAGGTAGANGVGITFPATQVASSDANCLDDYEEGTWTIGLTFGGASVALTTSSNTGRYTKVGRQVSVTGYIALTNKGTSVGAAIISGLPFTIAGSPESYSGASLRLNGVSYTGAVQALVNAGTTSFNLEQISTLGAVTDITDSNFNNGTSVAFNFTYTV